MAKRKPIPPPPAPTQPPTVVESIEPFSAALANSIAAYGALQADGGGGSGRGYDRVVTYHFTTSGSLSWQVDRDCYLVGWSMATSSPDIMIGGHNMTALAAADQKVLGPERMLFVDFSQLDHLGMRIPYRAGEYIYVVESGGVELYVNLYLESVQ